MRDPRTLPVLRLVLDFPDGSTFDESWTMETAGDAPDFIRPGSGGLPPPDWIEEPRRRWDHPQDPVTLSGRVKPGREAEAREALGAE